MAQPVKCDWCDRIVAADQAIYLNPFGTVYKASDSPLVLPDTASYADSLAVPYCLDCASQSFESEALVADRSAEAASSIRGELQPS